MVDVYYPYLIRPDALDVWMDPEVRSRLSWYYEVMNGYRPAKYLICKRVGMDGELDLKFMTEEELWKLHAELRKDFIEVFRRIRDGDIKLSDLETPRTSFLDIKIELVYRLVSPCRLCEHRCEVDRLGGR